MTKTSVKFEVYAGEHIYDMRHFIKIEKLLPNGSEKKLLLHEMCPQFDL